MRRTARRPVALPKPEVRDVVCPRCAAPARCFVSRIAWVEVDAAGAAELARLAAASPRRITVTAMRGHEHRYVVDLFPGLGAKGKDAQVVECPACGLSAAHRLKWPDEAYWQVEVHGQIVWGVDREHLVAILEFVRSGARGALVRKGRREGDWQRVRTFERLPRALLLGKHRDDVVRRVERLLAGGRRVDTP